MMEQNAKRTSLLQASKAGNVEKVTRILDEALNLDFPLQTIYDALSAASECGQVSTIQIFLTRGYDINGLGRARRTPLYSACRSRRRNTEAVQFLLTRGADVNKTVKDGRTPLTVSAQNGNYEITDILLGYGDSIDQQSVSGLTPLMLASSQGHSNVIKLLIDNGAQIDQDDRHGRTALIFAVSQGHFNAVCNLLEGGAWKTEGAQQLAEAFNYSAVVEKLKEHERLINTRSSESAPLSSGAGVNLEAKDIRRDVLSLQSSDVAYSTADPKDAEVCRSEVLGQPRDEAETPITKKRKVSADNHVLLLKSSKPSFHHISCCVFENAADEVKGATGVADDSATTATGGNTTAATGESTTAATGESATTATGESATTATGESTTAATGESTTAATGESIIGITGASPGTGTDVHQTGVRGTGPHGNRDSGPTETTGASLVGTTGVSLVGITDGANAIGITGQDAMSPGTAGAQTADASTSDITSATLPAYTASTRSTDTRPANNTAGTMSTQPNIDAGQSVGTGTAEGPLKTSCTGSRRPTTTCKDQTAQSQGASSTLNRTASAPANLQQNNAGNMEQLQQLISAINPGGQPTPVIYIDNRTFNISDPQTVGLGDVTITNCADSQAKTESASNSSGDEERS